MLIIRYMKYFLKFFIRSLFCSLFRIGMRDILNLSQLVKFVPCADASFLEVFDVGTRVVINGFLSTYERYKSLILLKRLKNLFQGLVVESFCFLGCLKRLKLSNFFSRWDIFDVVF